MINIFLHSWLPLTPLQVNNVTFMEQFGVPKT